MSVIEATRAASPVWLDDAGLLRARDAWVALSDHEWKLVDLLLEHRDRVVWREEVTRAVWGDQDVSAGALRGAIIRVRRRVKVLGVRIQTVRGRGFMLTIELRGSE